MEANRLSSGQGLGGRDVEALETEAGGQDLSGKRWKLKKYGRRPKHFLGDRFGWLAKCERKLRRKGRPDMSNQQETPIGSLRQNKPKPPVMPKPSGPRDPWTNAETECLITLFNRFYMANNRGNFRPKDWIDLSVEFNEWCRSSGVKIKQQQQIHDKGENLKKKYRKEKERETKTGGVPSKWKWFKLFDKILVDDPKHCGVKNGMDAGRVVSNSSTQASEDESEDVDSNLATSTLHDDSLSVADSQQQEAAGEQQQPTPVIISLDEEATPTSTATPTNTATPTSTATPSTSTGVKSKPVVGRKRPREQQEQSDNLATTMHAFANVFAQVSREQMEANANTQKETAKIQLEMIKMIMGYKAPNDVGPSSSC